MEKNTKKQEYIQKFMKYAPVEKIGNGTEIVLPLDEFFEWADPGSIGYNFYTEELLVPVFYRTFKQIRDLDEVEEIFIRIMDINDGYDEDWFSSDTVYVVDTLTKEKLSEIMRSVQPDIYPDDITEDWYWHKQPPVNLPYEVPNSKVLSMWWD